MLWKKKITRIVVPVLVGLSLVFGLTAATKSTTTKPTTTKPTTAKVPTQIPVLCFHDIGTPSSVVWLGRLLQRDAGKLHG